MVSVILRSNGAVSLLNRLVHEPILIHVVSESLVSSRYYKHSQLGVCPFIVIYRLLQTRIFKLMRGSTDGFDEGDFHAVMGLVYASAIVAEEDPMVDAHVDLVKLLAIEFVSTIDAKLVLQTLVIEQLNETLLLQRQLLIIIL